jgi:hypothetical protein
MHTLGAAILADDLRVPVLSFDPRWVTLASGVDGGYAGFHDLGFENKGTTRLASEIKTHEHG